MIDSINYKSFLIHSVFMVGVLVFAVSCSGKKTSDTADIANQQNVDAMTTDGDTIMVMENDKDAMFLVEAATFQLEEISLGQLAQQRGNSSHVKALGKMMEVFHTEALTELTAIAQSKSVSIPTSITDDSKEVYADLNEKTGNDFGKAYSSMMVEHHEDAIEMFEKTAKDTEDADISTWASTKVAGLKIHLKHAEACKKECSKM
jgi:putative membrane protein